MAEHLLEIYKGLPTEILLKENTRISEGLAKLIVRKELIIQALEERYAPEENLS